MTLRDWLPIGIAFLIPLVIAYGTWKITEQQNKIEEQRAQDLALLGYLDQMSTLVLEDLTNPKLQMLMRARTLAVLRRLDTSRKEEVMRYLIDAELVQQSVGRTFEISGPIFELSGAKLSGVNLYRADLWGANLSHADLSHADLSHANLSHANLSFANLRHANLRKTALSAAILISADLRGVEGITNEELERQAWSLEDATMRDGQRYEEWLKDKEGRGEDGENSGPS
jgi:uncharacterized protein YjbI with pentapeptide repeats